MLYDYLQNGTKAQHFCSRVCYSSKASSWCGTLSRKEKSAEKQTRNLAGGLSDALKTAISKIKNQLLLFAIVFGILVIMSLIVSPALNIQAVQIGLNYLLIIYIFGGCLYFGIVIFRPALAESQQPEPSRETSAPKQGSTPKSEAELDTFDSRKNSLETLIQDLRQIFTDQPQRKDRIRRAIDIAILQVLWVATALTDKLEHSLTSNLMEYDSEEDSLVITHALGMYARWRVFREFPVNDEKEGGSCARAWRDGKIVIIPDCSKSQDIMSFPFPEEKQLLKGVINIPVRMDVSLGGGGGVLNIDSPEADLLNQELEGRAREIQNLTREILTLRRQFEKMP